MAAVFTVLAVVVLSLFVTKVGAVALSLTGLSREASRFQPLDERLAGVAGEQEQARSREEFDDYKTRQEAEEHRAGRTDAETGTSRGEPPPSDRGGSR